MHAQGFVWCQGRSAPKPRSQCVQINNQGLRVSQEEGSLGGENALVAPHCHQRVYFGRDCWASGALTVRSSGQRLLFLKAPNTGDGQDLGWRNLLC